MAIAHTPKEMNHGAGCHASNAMNSTAYLVGRRSNSDNPGTILVYVIPQAYHTHGKVSHVVIVTPDSPGTILECIASVSALMAVTNKVCDVW